MAGIYVHIPFCRKACHYCDFHFSTSLKQQTDLVNAILIEIEKRQDYLGDQEIETIYFGGGTPSVLSPLELELILESINKNFKIKPDTEVTLEANPDDLIPNYIKSLHDIGFNRLSIGVQSFFEEQLEFMNRSHDSMQAREAIENVLVLFPDLSIDLIFGGQYSNSDNWTENLKIAIDYKIPHLSCYSLTIEEGTVFGSWVDKNRIAPIEDERQKNQFNETMDTLKAAGYEHYEISNYAKDQKYALHNTNYWKNKPYLGLGPSAHSYNGKERQWTVANNQQYLNSLNNDKPYFTTETLSQQDQYNEYILTSLRTRWGCDINAIKSFGPTYFKHFTESIVELVEEKKLEVHNQNYCLTRFGKLFADQVAETLFYLS